MKVFAQDGHQRSDKIKLGLSEPAVLDGVIFSSRYVNPDKVSDRFTEVRLANPEADILLDPEFYASWLKGTPNGQLGFLEKKSYFKSYRRRDLVRSEVVNKVLREFYETVADLTVSAHIAPNIYISQSFDSIEAGIAFNFIERTREAFEKSTKPVYATLAVDRKALLNPADFLSFLNDLTALPSPPDGFYVLVGGGPLTERSDLAQSEIFDASVIGGWMMANYSLSQNGFTVINGFADILTPFLAAAGAAASATGWWSNLRTFSMGRYVKPEGSGGQLPIIRYLSKALLNRIRFDERMAFSKIVPQIVNGLPRDMDYDNGIPDRTVEALQTWEALSSLNHEIAEKNLEKSLLKLTNLITRATAAYATLSQYGITGGYETTTEYLEQLTRGVDVFKRLAEI
jgi:hypothetical protein